MSKPHYWKGQGLVIDVKGSDGRREILVVYIYIYIYIYIYMMPFFNQNWAGACYGSLGRTWIASGLGCRLLDRLG